MIAGQESAAIEEACDVAEAALKEALVLHSSEAASTLLRGGNDGSAGIQGAKSETAGAS
jgi:hypothetical protein